MKYYKNMIKAEVILYKRRIKVENNFIHLKYGRVAIIMDRKINMYENSVDCRLLDLIMNDMNRSKQKWVKYHNDLLYINSIWVTT